jgi:hypothetical protein
VNLIWDGLFSTSDICIALSSLLFHAHGTSESIRVTGKERFYFIPRSIHLVDTQSWSNLPASEW